MRPTLRWISAKITARAPPPAPNTAAVSRPRSQPGVAASRLARKPSTSVLVERSVSPSYHSVLAEPDERARAVVRLRQRKHRLLVRHADVAADIAMLAQMRDELGEFFRRHRLAPVFGVEIMLLDPIIMDQRRARMRRRPGHDADCLAFLAHASATTLLRNTPICGTSISTTSPGLSHVGCSLRGASFTGVPVTMIS